MHNSRDVITVDGLGASGKSALAKGLARALGYGHLNSGLLYRAVAFICLAEGVDLTDSGAVVLTMSQHPIRLALDADGSSVVAIDEQVRATELLSAAVSRGASLVARHQEVRARLLELQREAFQPRGVVAEGRDMGTVIFPDARVKFFVIARLDVRAERRYHQLKGTQHQVPLEEIKRDLEERDTRDATSSVGTMKQPDGAIVIDNSDEPFDVVLARMVQVVTQ
jgi:cytidylate kinase